MVAAAWHGSWKNRRRSEPQSVHVHVHVHGTLCTRIHTNVSPVCSYGSWKIRRVPTFILPAIERRLLEKFQPDSFKTERRTNGHGYIDSSSDADQEYIYFMGSEESPSLRCKLQGFRVSEKLTGAGCLVLPD
ncbi:uncharacterized protein LOC127011036 [Drosophila biarmipes]|uniref:uncharacterized protein LOC127011036 n=1 Tax=Drosophila biarmipes TaxID=125945 RepID=UPI0021CD049A|nr:uncharacterized protein LOC127011036 [Drosophila biarmipes]